MNDLEKLIFFYHPLLILYLQGCSWRVHCTWTQNYVLIELLKTLIEFLLPSRGVVVTKLAAIISSLEIISDFFTKSLVSLESYS